MLSWSDIPKCHKSQNLRSGDFPWPDSVNPRSKKPRTIVPHISVLSKPPKANSGHLFCCFGRSGGVGWGGSNKPTGPSRIAKEQHHLGQDMPMTQVVKARLLLWDAGMGQGITNLKNSKLGSPLVSMGFPWNFWNHIGTTLGSVWALCGSLWDNFGMEIHGYPLI